jgi:hypothetical protein
LREKNAERNQRPGDRQDHDQERALNPARGVAQRVREPVLPGPEFPVDLDDAIQRNVAFRCVNPSGLVHGIQLDGGRVEPRQEVVAQLPDLEHALHVAHAVEPLVQPDHAGNVVGVGAAGEEARMQDGAIRPRLFQLEPGLPESARHHHRLFVVLEIDRSPRIREAQQVEHRLLLVFRPKALAFHVGAARREDVDTGDRHPDEHDDDREERRNDEQHALAHGEPATGSRDRNHESCGGHR